MKLVDNVFEISESFMKRSKYVSIDNDELQYVAKNMKKEGRPKFPLPVVQDVLVGIVYELVASSINYCYWYGRHDIRPCGASSTRMYELMINAFFDFNNSNLNICLDRFGKLLAINRFPLLQERISHLNELKENYTIQYCIDLRENYTEITNCPADLEYFFNELINRYPGFASDIFLKRASLFFIQLFRRFGWLQDELKLLHVPADYQIPKMLENYYCIRYNNYLKHSIETHHLIPKNSLEECEIRAATILAIKKLCELTDWNVAEVDAYFFLKRHDVTGPFHLTITTDY